MLRQEVYADDAGPEPRPSRSSAPARPTPSPSRTSPSGALQPRGGNRHAVFFTHAREAISYHYERNPADPRIQHALTLEVDDYGNVLKQAAIGYGRRSSIRVVDAQGQVQQVPTPASPAHAAIRPSRPRTLLTYTENRVTNADRVGRRRHRNAAALRGAHLRADRLHCRPGDGRSASRLRTSSSPTPLPRPSARTSSPTRKSPTRPPPPATSAAARSSGCARSTGATI